MPNSPIHSDPDILGGATVFVGTRVPAAALLDYLEGGESLEDFLEDFPTVTCEQAIAALELAKQALAAHAQILLDECVPRGLRGLLLGHNVLTVPETGWSGKKNGELMRLIAAGGFDVFLTVDQNIPYQQRLQSAAFAVIVLSAASNRLTDLAPLVPHVLTALATAKPGDVVELQHMSYGKSEV